jgi:flagellar hook-associated protein 3 FlgL
MFPDALVQQLNVLQTRQQRLENQASSGQRVQVPSDDPSAARLVLDMQAESQEVTQYQANISTLQQQSTTSASAMQQLKTIADRAGEIATQADGTASPQDLNNYATEVTQLIQQAAQLMNTQFQGSYVFGGTNTSKPPYAVATDSSGNITSVTYQGNTSTAQVEIAKGEMLSVQTVGANTTGSGPQGLITDSRTGADFFNHLISLQNNLKAGNTAAISSTDQANVSTDDQNIITQIASNAAVQSNLTTASTMASTRTTSLTQLISNQADADLAQTITQLSQTQNAYNAALQSGASVMQLSLLNYL